MALTIRGSQVPSYRSQGFEAGLGLRSRRARTRRWARSGRTCPHCEATATIYMVDTARVRAYLVCPECAHEWDTDRFEALA